MVRASQLRRQKQLLLPIPDQALFTASGYRRFKGVTAPAAGIDAFKYFSISENVEIRGCPDGST